MANGDNPNLVPDDYEPRPRSKYFPGARPDYIIPGPNRPYPQEGPRAMATGETALREAPTLPSTEQQNYLPDIPREPLTLHEQMARRRGVLAEKLNPDQSGWSRAHKIGHTLSVIGQDIGTAIEPGIMYNIPGTIPNMRMEYGELTREQGLEQEREAQRGEAKARTGLESRRLGLEEKKFGTLERLPGVERFDPENPSRVQYGYASPSDPTNTQWFDADQAGKQAPLPGAAIPGATIPGTQNAPSAPPPTPPGTIPHAGAQTPPPTAPPQYVYGKPTAAETPLTPQQIEQRNAQARSYWQRMNPGKPMPEGSQLGPRATQKDADAMDTMLNREQTQSGIQSSREATQEAKRESLAIEQHNAQLRDDEAKGKWLRAVDNDGKTHYITRGDYEAHQRDFKPNPGVLPPGSTEKAQDHNTILNEMQGRMNGLAEAAQKFDWKDGGQQKLVMQAMQQVEKNYPDQVLGIPIVSFIAHNLKQLGLEGANPQTRQYIVELLGLREAMLGMPKEITGGSRMMQASIDALYATLPSGETPDLDYAMRQLLVAQGTMDRLRGSRVPIVEGFNTVPKLPLLYEHEATDQKTGRSVFSDDRIHWFDENGRPVKRK